MNLSKLMTEATNFENVRPGDKVFVYSGAVGSTLRWGGRVTTCTPRMIYVQWTMDASPQRESFPRPTGSQRGYGGKHIKRSEVVELIIAERFNGR